MKTYLIHSGHVGGVGPETVVYGDEGDAGPLTEDGR